MSARVFGRVTGPCAYCGERAVNWDHVVPRLVVKNYNRSAPLEAPSIPAEWLEVVPSCFRCNMLKGPRRLVPPSWGSRVKAMNRFFGGTPWRVWSGATSDEAYRGTFV